MRIKVTFSNPNKLTYIPINTNYYMVKLINQLTYEYQRYLNSLNPSKRARKKFDLYTFSQLIIPQRQIADFKIGIKSSEFHWLISSPYYQFLGILAKELRDSDMVRISDRWFGVKEVSFITAPSFDESEAQFTCLSPVAVYRHKIKKRKEDDCFRNNYILPGEREYIRFLERDLLYKYNILRNSNRKKLELQLEFDPQYLEKRKNKITKIITLENEKAMPEQIRGVLAPLHVKAEPDVLKVIYDAGLGQLNNLGFGMVETVN